MANYNARYVERDANFICVLFGGYVQWVYQSIFLLAAAGNKVSESC